VFDQFLNKASELLANGESFAIAEVVRSLNPISGKSGDKAIISADGTIWGWIGGGCAQPAVVKEAQKALKDGRPRLVRISTSSSQEDGLVAYNMTCHSGGSLEVYVEPVLPRPHILILGRSPVARTLARLAKAINYTVSVAAPGADREAFPDADQVRSDLNLGELKISPQAMIVVSTQGEDDEEALEAALRTGATYVAFVASRAKAEKITVPAQQSGPTILAGKTDAARDPICGMSVVITNAKHRSEFEGRSFYFCCAGCKRAFDAQPQKYALAATSQ
jgi:xanthine dehydrogenase accessory factor